MTDIFELVDNSCEDNYYPLGVYSTIEKAYTAATEGDDPPGQICWGNECVDLEIRKRELDQPNPDFDEVVIRIRWSYIEESLDWDWKAITNINEEPGT